MVPAQVKVVVGYLHTVVFILTEVLSFSMFSPHEMGIFRNKYFTRHRLPLSGFAMVTAQVKVAVRCVRVVAFEMELVCVSRTHWLFSTV